MRIRLKSDSTALRAYGAAVVQGALLGAVVLSFLYPTAVQSGKPQAAYSAGSSNAPGQAARHDEQPVSQRAADFGGESPSADARAVADWIARVDDSHGEAFVVIDKKLAHLYLFNARAQLQASSPVLLGSALGDDSVPGIGDRPIDHVLPHERTTPAGRFVGERGKNARGEDVVWVDYGAAVSMHRVVTSNAAEHRLERLATPSAEDNRISYGCINVPTAFYDLYIRPTFATQLAVIYVLPDVAPIRQFFGV